jgi:serine/threonine-protein kinase
VADRGSNVDTPAPERAPGGARVSPPPDLAATGLAPAGPLTAPEKDPARNADPDADAPDPRVGRLLGGVYRLVERIGEGGMGVVYAARHETLGRRFAVKLLNARTTGVSASSLERFRQEAVRASQLDHEHIVDVVHFDRGEDDGEVFLVMELLQGESLAERLRQTGPLAIPDALRIAHQIADALGAAHAQGIVHRDLKPENVFLCRRRGADFVKILDFGISKVQSPEIDTGGPERPGDPAGEDGARLTATGALLGTPLYMSPEQARGELDRVDRRADVYALGAMLYEMLTGTPPFQGSNHYQLLWKHGQEPPEPPRARAPEAGIPASLEAALLQALTKDPDARFPSMDAFAAALPGPPPEPGARGTSVPPGRPTSSGGGEGPGAQDDPRPYGLRRFLFELALVAAVAGLLVGAALLVRTLRGPDPSPPSPEEGRNDLGSPAPPGDERDEGATGDPPATPSRAGGRGELEEAPREAGGVAEAQVPLRFESAPPGAEVQVGDRVLGRTPLVAPLPAGDGDDAVPVRFRLEGHRDALVRVVPTADARVEATLEPIPPTRRRPPRPAPLEDDPPPPDLPFKKRF